jgi:hypothetical protein
MTRDQKVAFRRYTKVVAKHGYKSVQAAIMRFFASDDSELLSLMRLVDFTFEAAERELWNK